MQNKILKLSVITASLIMAGMAQAQTLADNANIDDSHSTKILVMDVNEQTDGDIQVLLDLGWDSEYISQGRNNLQSGGIYWTTAAVQRDNLNLYTTLGRGDSQHYIEWNFGIEYGLDLGRQFEASLGYQRLEIYGDERGSDNELFASFAYAGLEWLTPSVTYTYATEADGYFVEFSLHSSWELSDKFSVTPYATQGFDFGYVTQAHDGANNLQLGIESEYAISEQVTLSGHISHSIAQEDIKQEAAGTGADLDETYAGIHLSWSF